MTKIHSYKGFDFYYIKIGKQRGAVGYFFKDINLGNSVEDAKSYIDWCLENLNHENNLLKQ